MSTSRQVYAAGASLSAVSPPVPKTPPGPFPCGGVTTQVSNPESSTACTKALKKNPDTRGAAPSLLRMRGILLQTALSRDKLFTTTGQLLSSTEIARPRYPKEVTISRGRP